VDPDSVFAVAGWFTLHLGALAAAWGTRVAADTRLEIPMQLACFSAMAAVGAVAWICGQLEIGLWIPSGITLIAMVLTAVLDFRHSPDPPAAMHSAARC
jgi:hypothetical protein